VPSAYESGKNKHVSLDDYFRRGDVLPYPDYFHGYRFVTGPIRYSPGICFVALAAHFHGLAVRRMVAWLARVAARNQAGGGHRA